MRKVRLVKIEREMMYNNRWRITYWVGSECKMDLGL